MPGMDAGSLFGSLSPLYGLPRTLVMIFYKSCVIYFIFFLYIYFPVQKQMPGMAAGSLFGSLSPLYGLPRTFAAILEISGLKQIHVNPTTAGLSH